ncbi:profilin, putative [Entamoeba invadens IP1]|uniref:Profilin, putative n=2 Tax=Entamoeba invadens TaxID=33085 RepID=A0A0A1U494_ENTIV|nr:profilin, putative [Entamoeba invadens IP1]ELP89053.1 profilin, putative [Entamoeba invadens IP1]BAK61680.1 profilin [Entamoeba invadens]|eukprot:XP_004255824.1 profilin, putative [Entamoeba invadens IP1]
MSEIYRNAIYKYVVGPGKGNGGAVCGRDGGVWGHSETLEMSLEEARNIHRVCLKGLTGANFVMSGVTFAITDMNDDQTIISAKAVSYQSGCTIILTRGGFVVGYFDSPNTSEQSIIATKKLARYVKELGY